MTPRTAPIALIANLKDIDLKFSGLISDVNIDNPAKYGEVSMPRTCLKSFFGGFWSVFLKIRFWGILVCNLQTSQLMSRKISDFVPPHQTFGKNFMVIHPVVSEILGGLYHPPDTRKLSKRADAITVNP